MTDHQDCNEGYYEHNCRETIQRVMLALDGELGNDEEVRFIQDLKICSHCLEKYNIEKEFKLFLSHKVEKKCCAEELKVNIRLQLSRLRYES